MHSSEIQKLPILTNKTFNFNRNKIPEPSSVRNDEHGLKFDG